MKQNSWLFLVFIVFFASCTSAYKIGQTPDDVYYSPAKYIRATEEKETRARQEEREEYSSWANDLNDAFLRMRIQNRNRWNTLDDFSYWNDSRFFNNCNCNCVGNNWNNNLNNNWGNNWNKFSNWNNINLNTSWNNCFNNNWGWNNGRSGWGWGWNNPVWIVSNYKNPAAGGYTAGSNLSAFRNRNYSNNNYNYNVKTGQPNNNSNLGGLLKRVFTTSGDNSNNWDRPTRTFNSGSSSSSSGTNSNAGGNSGGTRSSSTTNSSAGGRGGRGGGN